MSIRLYVSRGWSIWPLLFFYTFIFIYLIKHTQRAERPLTYARYKSVGIIFRVQVQPCIVDCPFKSYIMGYGVLVHGCVIANKRLP